MKTYLVLYRNNDLTLGENPFSFQCQAEDTDHAEEQLINAEPDAEIVWVFEGNNYNVALDEYYSA